MKQLIIITAFFLSLSSLYGQVGKVGINTNTPVAILHVKDSSVLFTGMASLPASPGNTPVSGAGSRLLWYADKAAFRVGRVTDQSWDKDSIGIYSVGAGHNAKAKGSYSIAMGNTTYALGHTSTALGFGTVASGDFSTSLGYGAESSGNRSISMGYLSFARGEYSMAFGRNVQAEGESTVAIGYNAVANGLTAMAFGYASEASGTGAMAIGQSKATRDLSVSIGYGAEANGNFSSAFGVNAVANGEGSVAIGNMAETNGSSAFATAHSTANGVYSCSFGDRTVANPFSSFVLGRFNDTSFISRTSWQPNDPLFIIGNGTGPSDVDRRNALTVLKNGNTGIGVPAPVEKLEVAGAIKAAGYSYTTPQTKYLALPASAFQLMPVDGTSTAGLSTTTLAGGQTLLNGTAGVAAWYEAPVYLPDGAIVTGILLNVRDASGTYEVSAELREVNGVASGIVAAVPGSGTTATPGNTTISATGLSVNINAQRPYFLRFNTIEFNGNLRIYNALITYTVSSIE